MATQDMREYSREELLSLTPARYLADGYVDKDGKPRLELQNAYATAAANQFLASNLAPQELGFTYEAMRQILPVHAESTASKRIRAAIDESLEVVRGIVRQANNAGLLSWLNECAAQVKTTADVDALMGHILAAHRLYTVMVAFREP